VADEWIEVNLVLPSLDDRIAVLLEVIDPLVHDRLGGRVGSWHFVRPVRRRLNPTAPSALRPLERTHARVKDRTYSARFLTISSKTADLRIGTKENTAPEEGPTPAKRPQYGAEMWEVTYKLWRAKVSLP
jgi:hypothetical protein